MRRSSRTSGAISPSRGDGGTFFGEMIHDSEQDAKMANRTWEAGFKQDIRNGYNVTIVASNGTPICNGREYSHTIQIPVKS